MQAKNEFLRLFAAVAAFTAGIVAVKLSCVNEMRLGFLAGTKRNLQLATSNVQLVEDERKLSRLPLEKRPRFATVIKCRA